MTRSRFKGDFGKLLHLVSSSGFQLYRFMKSIELYTFLSIYCTLKRIVQKSGLEHLYCLPFLERHSGNDIGYGLV